MKPHLLLLPLILAAISGLTSCDSKKTADQANPPQADKTVRITDCLNVANVHVLIADKEGFFKNEGLKVNVTYSAVGKLCMDTLVNGGADYAGVTEMNLAQMMFSDPDYKIIAEMSESLTGIKILGRKDKGTSTPADLRGKKIALFVGVNIHVIATKILEEAGIPLNEVQFVNLKPADAATAFINGDVDAVVTWEPLLSRINDTLGDKAVQLVPDTSKYWTYKMVLTTKASYLQANGKEAAAVLRALLKADDFIISHPDVTADLVSKQLSLDRAKVPAYLAEIHHEIRMTDQLVPMMDYEAQWYSKVIPEFRNTKLVMANSTPFISHILDPLLPKERAKPAASQPATTTHP